MYEAYYGLRGRPFDLVSDPRFLVLTEAHQEALSNLRHAIDSAKAVTLLIGEAGTGKTTIIRTAIEKQPAKTHCVHLHNPSLTRGEFIEMLGVQFGLSDRAGSSKTHLLTELEQLLRGRVEAGERTVLVVDEAQSLPSELLEEVRLLTNLEAAGDKLISLIVAGQPELAKRLNESAWRNLKQRIALRCELRPLSLRESAIYIGSRISAAGGVPTQMFTQDAITLIHEYARGIPRSINVIADNALLGGFAAEQQTVTRQLVLDVCEDFDIPAPTRGVQEGVSFVASSRASQTLNASEKRVVDAAIPLLTLRPELAGRREGSHDGERDKTKVATGAGATVGAIDVRK